MATMFVRHHVKDFSTWKKRYDSFDEERKGMGVTAHGAYQAEGDACDVTVFHDFDNMEAAKAFANSARLKEVMQEAGVDGAPDIWFATKA